MKCYNCNHFGHFAYECRSKKKDERAILVDKQEDDEPTLLMAKECELLQSVQETTEEVILNE